MGLYAQMTAD